MFLRSINLLSTDFATVQNRIQLPIKHVSTITPTLREFLKAKEKRFFELEHILNSEVCIITLICLTISKERTTLAVNKIKEFSKEHSELSELVEHLKVLDSKLKVRAFQTIVHSECLVIRK